MSKFLLMDDHSEIEDDETFQELALYHKPLQVLAIGEGTGTEKNSQKVTLIFLKILSRQLILDFCLPRKDLKICGLQLCLAQILF